MHYFSRVRRVRGSVDIAEARARTCIRVISIGRPGELRPLDRLLGVMARLLSCRLGEARSRLLRIVSAGERAGEAYQKEKKRRVS
jgi:hypothetical protein